MPQSVFISYARKASREHAEALHRELGADVAFLDTEDIRYGDPFPERLLNAVLDSRVVVILAEPVYFTRWYCLLEYRLARRPYLRLLESAGATDAERNDTLRGIVLAIPPGDMDPMLDRFPPFVQGQNWAPVDKPAEIAELVRERLAANPPTFRERYQAVGELDRIRDLVRETTQLPYPRRVGSIPAVPLDLPQSIRERFVGRANDIWRIHDVLTTESGGPSAASLTGAIEAGGGFGKTRLALEYLYRFGTRHFRGGLFWINAEQDLEDQFYGIVKALNPSAPDVAVLREAQGGVSGALARLIRARPDGAPPPLFVIDNVPEPEKGKPPKPLRHWCPVLGEAAVLTTSRRRISLSGGDIITISLYPLDADAAVRLLTGGGAHTQLTRGEAVEIAEWVGNLPLALELLNGLLVSGAMSGRELVEMSREQRPAAALDGAMEVLRATVPEGSLRGVTDAFAASYERLSEQEQLATRLIAWMAPAVVPELVLEIVDPVFTPAVRATLRSRHFVTAPEQAGDKMFGSMHRVLADFLRSRSPDASREHALLTTAFANLGGTRTVDERLELTRTVGAVIAAFARNSLGCATQISDTFNEVAALARLLVDAGAHAWAQLAQERLVDARWRIEGEEHLDTLVAMNNLAETRRARGDHVGAQALHERVLSVSLRVLGEEHPHTLVSMSNLATAFQERGNFTAAQHLQEQVLSSRRRILGEDDPRTLTSMGNLAFTLWARGEHALAQELEERALSARIRISGEDHPDTLTAMDNLAGTLVERGDLAGAQELQSRALAVRRRVQGEDHVYTLGSMNNLAEILRARGEPEEAQALQEQVVSASLRILGEEHPRTIMAMSNLAFTLFERGDHATAYPLAARALALSRKVLGEKHSNTSRSAWNLLSTLIDRGDKLQAEVVLRDLVWILDSALEPLSANQKKIREWLPDAMRQLKGLP